MYRSQKKYAQRSRSQACRAVVLWIDWYPYHVARFKGLQRAFGGTSAVRGIEFVGGIGVHAGLKFREEIPEDLPVDTLLPRSSWRESSKIALALAAWRRLSELNPELVLVPGYYTLPAVAAAMWARVHRRISVLMTESGSGDHVRVPWKEKAKSLAIRSLFDWAVAGGTAHVRYLESLGVKSDRILNFYDVVDNDELCRRTAGLRRTSNAEAYKLPAKYFLYVGRLAPEKNVAGLIRAWQVYREQGGNWPLVLVGDGAEGPALRELAAQSPFAKDVIFVGHKKSQEALPYFSFAACFVLPSVREPWGLVVNEAMAASLPLIVSKKCGCAEDLVREGQNGFLYDPEFDTELTVALTKMEALSSDEWNDMRRASSELIQRFSPDNFGNEIARLSTLVQERSDTQLTNSASSERMA
ncbi:glycosyltransferase family 4 protein [Silvibacterium sp.]|uniref:glycosyltransferase family 4 protein n=1 Tax=Silvibacterium sp. TaxID=1964179 RepID=UPI0039E4C0B2